MDRRSLLLGGLALGASSVLGATTAIASQIQLGPRTPFGTPMRVWVQQPQVVKQSCPEWCWAASISMIFAAHGHQVNQARVVANTFGGVVRASSGNTRNITANLSQTWLDDAGNSFQSTVNAGYDSMNGILEIDNYFIVQELASDRPLLYANTHHAMVMVAMEYFDTPFGPSPSAVGVLDPYPGIADFHVLSQPELVPAHLGGQMTYLASVDIV
jgi:hypothetical protein